jgi:predicted regulator of Ras-like GTPase activity (Roadblock/LC7/MglB family)
MSEHHRETLFVRALERLVAAGAYREAYLVNASGLIWAKTAAARREDLYAALAAAAGEMCSRADAQEPGRVEEVALRKEDGDAVIFHRFGYRGREGGDFFIVAVPVGGGDAELLARVVREIKGDLEAFY